MKYSITLFATILMLSMSIPSMAKTQKVIVNISGLTCSQCSRSVEMQLRKLSFVASIQMDLQNTTATLLIKENANTDFAAIAKSVTNAGFSVAGLEAYMYTQKLKINAKGCMDSQDGNFHIANPATINTSKEVTRFEFIGKPFNNKKPQLKPNDLCQKTATYHLKAL